MLRGNTKNKLFKPSHAEPGAFWLNYILLPYGEYYAKTNVFLTDAKCGDKMRFFNGPDVTIEKVMLIDCDATCDFLCKMRYGITWDKALKKWTDYARMEGHGAGVLSKTQCLLIVYRDADDSE